MTRTASVSIVVAAAVALTLLIPLAKRASAEIVKIPAAGGTKLEVEVHLPPDFDAATAYSILVSPGEYYWKNRPSQPGWIVVGSDAFYGDGRIANSKRVLDWLRTTYEVRGGGFHIAGWSANSAGVFDIAMTHREDFLSVTGIAGMPGAGSEDRLGRLAGIHVQFIVGERDAYWRRGSERWFELMQQEGIPATLEIIPKADHVMPEIADEPIFERLNRLVEMIEAKGR